MIHKMILTFSHRFSDLFSTPRESSAAPQALGFDGFFRGSFSYHFHNFWSVHLVSYLSTFLTGCFMFLDRWEPFDPAINWPDLGPRFAETERSGRLLAFKKQIPEKRDLDWSTVLKRTFESYIRGEQPNMYGEWIKWS